jgi:hypothetical protein
LEVHQMDMKCVFLNGELVKDVLHDATEGVWKLG